MIVGVPKETLPGERRVALVPMSVRALTKSGVEVLVETGAGYEAGFPDDEFTDRGAKIATSRDEVFGSADVVAQVSAYGACVFTWSTWSDAAAIEERTVVSEIGEQWSPNTAPARTDPSVA